MAFNVAPSTVVMAFLDVFRKALLKCLVDDYFLDRSKVQKLPLLSKFGNRQVEDKRQSVLHSGNDRHYG